MPKPQKPRADYPLYLHRTGETAKTIAGKTRYYGSCDHRAGAEQEYLD